MGRKDRRWVRLSDRLMASIASLILSLSKLMFRDKFTGLLCEEPTQSLNAELHDWVHCDHLSSNQLNGVHSNNQPLNQLTGVHCDNLSAATSWTFKFLLCDFPLDLTSLCNTWWGQKVMGRSNEREIPVIVIVPISYLFVVASFLAWIYSNRRRQEILYLTLSCIDMRN